MAAVGDDDKFGCGNSCGVGAALRNGDELVVTAPDDEGWNRNSVDAFGDGFSIVFGIVCERALGETVIGFELEGEILADEFVCDAGFVVEDDGDTTRLIDRTGDSDVAQSIFEGDHAGGIFKDEFCWNGELVGTSVRFVERFDGVESRDPAAEGFTGEGELIDFESAQKFTEEVNVGLDRVIDEGFVGGSPSDLVEGDDAMMPGELVDDVAPIKTGLRTEAVNENDDGTGACVVVDNFLSEDGDGFLRGKFGGGFEKGLRREEGGGEREKSGADEGAS